MANTNIGIQFTEKNKVRVSVNFENTESKRALYEYNENKKISYTPKKIIFEKEFDSRDTIKTPFCEFLIEKKHDFEVTKNYYIQFKNINSIVSKYRRIYIKDLKSGTSLLDLSLTGSNKGRLVDYLNTSVKVLGGDQKENKIAYAIKTKKYIDTLFKNEAKRLQQLEIELSKFKDSTNLYNIESEGNRLFEKIIEIDEALLLKKRSLDYIKNLRDYLISHDQKTKDIPAPTITEINEPTTISF